MIAETSSQKKPRIDPVANASALTPRNILLILFGALALLWIWHWNYNLLGDFFYDYSIFASSGGYLEHGMRPYRDFTTSLQSLPIYLCYAAELVFGPRYLSLAYANLMVGLSFYAATLLMLKKFLPLPVRVVASMALCVATFFIIEFFGATRSQ